MEKALHKCVVKPQSNVLVATRIIDVTAFTVLVAKFFNHEIAKSSLDKAKTEERFNKLLEPVQEKKIMVKEKIQKKKNGLGLIPKDPDRQDRQQES